MQEEWNARAPLLGSPPVSPSPYTSLLLSNNEEEEGFLCWIQVVRIQAPGICVLSGLETDSELRWMQVLERSAVLLTSEEGKP